MFKALFGLVMQKLSDVGESSFAGFFGRHYGPDSPCRGLWFLGAGGLYIFYPTNNMEEDYYSDWKGSYYRQIAAVANLSANYNRFLNHELKKICDHDYLHRCGLGHGNSLQDLGDQQLPMSVVMIALAGLMGTSDYLVLEGGEGWLCNMPSFVGRGVPDLRRNDLKERVASGNIKQADGITLLEELNDPDKFSACGIFSMCHVREVTADKNTELLLKTPISLGLVGDCYICRKGLLCPCVAFVYYLLRHNETLLSRMATVSVSRDGIVWGRKRKRWLSNGPTPSDFDNLYHYIVFNSKESADEVDKFFGALLEFICGLTAIQLDTIRRQRGILIPHDWFPHLKTTAEMLKVITKDHLIDLAIVGTDLAEHIIRKKADYICAVGGIQRDRMHKLHHELFVPAGNEHRLPLSTRKPAPAEAATQVLASAGGLDEGPGETTDEFCVALARNPVLIVRPVANAMRLALPFALVTESTRRSPKFIQLDTMFDPDAVLSRVAFASYYPFLVSTHQGAHRTTSHGCVLLAYLIATFHLTDIPGTTWPVPRSDAGLVDIISNRHQEVSRQILSSGDPTISRTDLEDVLPPTVSSQEDHGDGESEVPIELRRPGCLWALQHTLWRGIERSQPGAGSLEVGPVHTYLVGNVMLDNTDNYADGIGTDPLGLDLITDLRDPPANTRVSAVYCQGSHVVSIIRLGPIVLGGTAQVDYKFNVIDTLEVQADTGDPRVNGRTGQSVRLAMKGTATVLGYLKRRATFLVATGGTRYRNGSCVLVTLYRGPSSVVPSLLSSFSPVSGALPLGTPVPQVFSSVEDRSAPFMPMPWIRHLAAKMCEWPMCDKKPWEDFGETVLARRNGRLRSVPKREEYRNTLNAMQAVGRFRGERARGSLQTLADRLAPYGVVVKTVPNLGQSHACGLGSLLNVPTLKRYINGNWLSHANIEIFWRNLSWLQAGEFHPDSVNFFIKSARQPTQPIPWMQYRILARGRPRAYLVKPGWDMLLLGIATNRNELPGNFYRKWLSMTLPQRWEHNASLTLPTNTQSAPDREIRRLREPVTDENKYHSVVFPINIPDLHWFTVVADLSERTILLYDFLNPAIDGWVPERRRRHGHGNPTLHGARLVKAFQYRVMELIGDYLNADLEHRGRLRVTWRFNDVITETLQRDGYNCAVLDCLVAWMTVHLERAPRMADFESFIDFDNPASFGQMRAWMAYSATQDRLWFDTALETLVNTFKADFERPQEPPAIWGPVESFWEEDREYTENLLFGPLGPLNQEDEEVEENNGEDNAAEDDEADEDDNDGEDDNDEDDDDQDDDDEDDDDQDDDDQDDDNQDDDHQDDDDNQDDDNGNGNGQDDNEEPAPVTDDEVDCTSVMAHFGDPSDDEDDEEGTWRGSFFEEEDNLNESSNTAATKEEEKEEEKDKEESSVDTEIREFAEAVGASLEDMSSQSGDDSVGTMELARRLKG
jgi:hypothetical protein